MLVLLKRFSRYPETERARAEFESAQKVEERFHKDFDAVDFTSIGSIKAGRARSAGQTSYPAGLLVRHPNHEPSLASEF